MKIKRLLALAVLALIVVGALGFQSSRTFAKNAASQAAQVTDCSMQDDDAGEVADVADTDDVEEECGDQTDDGSEAEDAADTDDVQEEVEEENGADDANEAAEAPETP